MWVQPREVILYTFLHFSILIKTNLLKSQKVQRKYLKNEYYLCTWIRQGTDYFNTVKTDSLIQWPLLVAPWNSAYKWSIHNWLLGSVPGCVQLLGPIHFFDVQTAKQLDMCSLKLCHMCYEQNIKWINMITDLLKHIIFCHVLKLCPGAAYVSPICQLREGRVQSWHVIPPIFRSRAKVHSKIPVIHIL